MTDYQRIRNDNICPFCSDRKDHGLIACWPCFRAERLRNGKNPAQRNILERRETTLAKAI